MNDQKKETWWELAQVWPKLPLELQKAVVLLVESMVICFDQRDESPNRIRPTKA